MESNHESKVCPLCQGSGALEAQRLTGIGLANGAMPDFEEAIQRGSLGRLVQIGRTAERYLDPKGVSLEAEYARINGQLLQASRALVKEREADIRNLAKEEEERRTKLLVEIEKKVEDLEKRRKELEEERLRETKDMRVSLEQILKTIVTPRGKGDMGEVVTIKDLKTACPQDEFTDIKSDKKGVDITATVMDGALIAGKVVVSVKYDAKWEGGFIDQAKRNMEQESAGWGILVSASFPHDALNEKVYLHRSRILVAKPDYAPIAYMALREAVLVSSAQREQLKAEIDRIGQQERMLGVVREWATGDGVSKAVSVIEAAARGSADTDEIIEKWVKYAQTSGDRVKKLQHELRQKLIEATGLLQDLREKLQAEVRKSGAA